VVLACATAFATVLTAGPAQAQDDGGPTNLFGSRGLIGTPSARMAPDGELSVGASFLKNNQHYNLGFQILPWLEGNFRYSGLQNFFPGYPVYYDRAFGMKARLWDEGSLLPAVAVGVEDIVGTGVYSGEYVVASKRFGDVDTSLGIGWGRRGETGLFKNPLAIVFPSFDNRQSFFGQAGQTDFKAFFHGHKVGLFGGAVWHTPLDGLSLSIEYDSDTYSQEKFFGSFLASSQVNYGLTYDISSQTQAGLYWLYGSAIGGSFSLRLDPTRPQYPQKIEAPPPEMMVRTDEQRQRALAALLQTRDPRNVQRARLFEKSNVERNGFIDALWRQGGDYGDIQVRQGILDLTVAGLVSSTRCEASAQLVRGVGADINQVRLHDAGGRRSVTCPIRNTVESAPFSAASWTDQNLTMPVMQVQTIDATAVTTGQNRLQRERAIRKAIAAQNIQIDALALGNGELVLYYSNKHYFTEVDAIDRMVRVLSREAPPEIERFHLIAVMGGVPAQEFDILRSPMERSYQQEDGKIFDQSVSVSPPAMNQPVLAEADGDNYPRFQWGFYPQFRQALFDPNQPFGVQFLGAAYANVDITRGLSLWGTLEANLYDDFDTSRGSNSTLPHVRSDFIKYFTQGKTGISSLAVNYQFRLSPTVHAAVRAGYLEGMFAGAGGEFLWRPEGARWTLGGDIYEVWQRDFDRLLGLQHYHQTTGHLSLYYDSPWYDLNFQLRAGQYLAGDRGFTFQVTRRFSTGVEIGAFFTRTNVSAAQFGEGSFDKGIIIRIPLGWIAPIETQGQLAMDLRPVQRDGGQVLNGDAYLYEMTRTTSEGELIRGGLAAH
jgi:exopolysaccharide biosynthesis protein YbjH